MSTEVTVKPGSSELAWFKSSYSGGEGGECLEVAATLGAVHIRDSKVPDRAQLVFRSEEWSAFVRYTVER